MSPNQNKKKGALARDSKKSKLSKPGRTKSELHLHTTRMAYFLRVFAIVGVTMRFINHLHVSTHQINQHRYQFHSSGSPDRILEALDSMQLEDISFITFYCGSKPQAAIHHPPLPTGILTIFAHPVFYFSHDLACFIICILSQEGAACKQMQPFVKPTCQWCGPRCQGQMNWLESGGDQQLDIRLGISFDRSFVT